MLSYFFPTFCSFGRHNLFHEDFVIPALDQETYGEFLRFLPGLGVFTLERFSCSEDNSWKASPFQDFFIPALDQETFREFLQWLPGLGVFTLERFSCTEEDSRVSIEVWASSLEMKQEEPTYSSAEKPMISTNGEKTPNGSVPAPEASDKTKKKSKGCVPTTEFSDNSETTPKGSIPTAEASVKTKKKSKGGQKKKKSTSEEPTT